MKFIEYKKLNKTSSASELLSDCVLGGLKNNPLMQNAIRQSTILSFWSLVVGKKFEKFTKPIKIKNSTLFVSAKSPVIVQELDLIKKRLLEKINSYSKPLGIEINDIVLSYKNFVEAKKENDFVEDKPIWYNNENFEEIELDGKYQDDIRSNINKISFLNDEQKNNLASKIFDVKKAQIIRKN